MNRPAKQIRLRVDTMNDEASISFPSGYSTRRIEGDASEALRDHFQKHVSFLRDTGALDLTSDCLRHPQIEAIRVTTVCIQPGSVQVHYEIDHSEFRACEGLHLHHTSKRSLTGKQTRTGWTFPMHKPSPPRGTHEEF